LPVNLKIKIVFYSAVQIFLATETEYENHYLRDFIFHLKEK